MSLQFRRVVGGAALVVGLCLTGCVSVPGAGPVQAGEKLATRDEADYVQFQPLPPQPGASQTEIIDGFIAAMVASSNDYQVARQYLTVELSRRWNPSAEILVDEGARQQNIIDTNTVALQVVPVARLNGDGVLTPTAPGKLIDIEFKLVQENGNWRIASAPTGILLSKSMFAAVWSPYTLYYVSAGGGLVPEVRWFMRRRAVTSEAVKALLLGPTAEMSGILHSSFPSGTVLNGGSVPVAGGTATVDLSGRLSQIDGELLSELRGQLRATLLGMDEVRRVRILTDGVPVENLPEGNRGEIGSAAIEPVLGNRLFAFQKGVLGELANGKVWAGEKGSLYQKIAETAPLAVSLSVTGHRAAVLTAAGVQVVSEQGVRSLDGRVGLLAPSMDQWDWVWSMPNDDSGEMLVANANGSERVLEVPWLADEDVAAIRISPDGSRLTALVQGVDGERVLSAGVMRDAFGFPYSVSGSPQTIFWGSGTGLDFDWIDDLTFVVLEEVQGISRVQQIGLGELPVQFGTVQNGAQIIGGVRAGQAYVRTANGTVLRWQGSGWQQLGTHVDTLVRRG